MSWTVVGDTFTLFGTGPVPRIVGGTPDPGPVTPPVPPPPPPPDEDHSSFIWPPQPVLGDHPEQRYAGLGAGFYVGEDPFRNPTPGASLYAGHVENPDARVGSWVTYGYRVWAPVDADPALIRRVLKTGHI